MEIYVLQYELGVASIHLFVSSSLHLFKEGEKGERGERRKRGKGRKEEKGKEEEKGRE